MKISLAGDLGSGKSTVAKLLMPAIGAEYYGTGLIAREIAASHGMDIAGLNIYMETHPEIDHEFDDRLVALSDDPRTLIIDSRMAWHFTRDTLRVYLTVDPTVAAIRIMRDEKRGTVEKFASLEDAVARICARKESERKRYFELYGVDCKDLTNYDLVIDTTYASPEDVAAVIERSFRHMAEGRRDHIVDVCPRRFYYPDEAPDMEEVSRLCDALFDADDTPRVTAVYQNENFYIVDGAATVLAYSLSERAHVPCNLIKEEIDTASYVKMEDSL